jgi:S1-C subfamily serine protease
VVDIIQHTMAMRAAKSIKIYLDKHPNDPPDETLLNLLGTCLYVAEQHTQGKQLLEQCAAVYQKQNARLEQTRPGEKRWGIQWLSAGEVEKRMAERKKQLDKVAQLQTEASAAYHEWEHQQALFIPQGPQHLRYATQAQVNAAENNYNAAVHAVADAQKKINSLPWLADVEPVLPPMPKGLTAVASADSGSGTNESGASIFAVPNITLHGPSSSSVGSTGDTALPPPPAVETPHVAGSNSTPPASNNSPPSSQAPVAPSRPPVHISIPRHALAVAISKTQLLSAADVIGNATRVRMEDANGLILSAHVVAHDERLALLEIDAGQISGMHFVNLADGFSGGALNCTAVPQENVFGPQPMNLSGNAPAPPQGGDWLVSLADHPRLPGSPLFNSQGQLVGIITAKREDVRTRLPAVGIAQVKQFLTAQSALPNAPSSSADPTNVYEVTVQEN